MHMNLYWDEQKNILLKSTRNIWFEEIAHFIENGGDYLIEAHPNAKKYPHQHIICFKYRGYMIVVPCVSHADGFFLKTIYPSRKMNKKHIF